MISVEHRENIPAGCLCDGCRRLDLGWCDGCRLVTRCDYFEPTVDRQFVSNNNVFDLAPDPAVPPRRPDEGNLVTVEPGADAAHSADAEAPVFVKTEGRRAKGEERNGEEPEIIRSAMAIYHRVIARKFSTRERQLFRPRRTGAGTIELVIDLAVIAMALVLLISVQSCAGSALYGQSEGRRAKGEERNGKDALRCFAPRSSPLAPRSSMTEVDPAGATNPRAWLGTRPTVSPGRSIISKNEGRRAKGEERNSEELSLPFRPSPLAPRPSSRFETTGYCPCRKCCGPNARGVTASGKPVRPGMCAADWRVLPRGTAVDVPGYGRAVVEDKGGAIKGRRIDLYFPTHKQALAWGRRCVGVRVTSSR